MRLKTGDMVLRPEDLTLVGWTEGDGSGHEGYQYLDYFRDGVYVGPDAHGIEPVFSDH